MKARKRLIVQSDLKQSWSVKFITRFNDRADQCSSTLGSHSERIRSIVPGTTGLRRI
jgi:hypothetical protein